METSGILAKIQNLVLARRQPEIRQGDADVCQGCAISCPDHSHREYIYKQVIEDHVTDAHQYRHDARCVHIASRLEHHLRSMIEEDERQSQRINQEIARGIDCDVAAATQPIRQGQMDRHSYQGKTDTKKQATNQGMTKNLSSLDKIVGTDEMRHLHREPRGCRTEQAAYQPCGRFYQSDASRSLSTEMPHHRSVDEEHHHRGNLRQHRRDAQPHNQVEFLPASHVTPQADGLHQIISLFTI